LQEPAPKLETLGIVGDQATKLGCVRLNGATLSWQVTSNVQP
jgi:hypothetical protein